MPFISWRIGWSEILEIRDWRAASRFVMIDFCYVGSVLHSGVLRFLIWILIFSVCSTCVSNRLSCWGPDKHATASISNSIFRWAVGVYMWPISLLVFPIKHLQSQGHVLCWYLLFSREQTRYLQENVALRSSWFQSLLQRRFSSLTCGSKMSFCVLLRSLARWLRLCLFSLFLLGAASFLWSGWPGSPRSSPSG